MSGLLDRVGGEGAVGWLVKAVIPGLVVWSLGVTFGGIWWASDLTRRLWVVEQTTNGGVIVGERVTKLEAKVDGVDRSLDKIEVKVDRILERQVRRSERSERPEP